MQINYLICGRKKKKKKKKNSTSFTFLVIQIEAMFSLGEFLLISYSKFDIGNILL
jgi:hypothetical protein